MVNPVIGELTAAVDRARTVVEGAVVLLDGLGARIEAAIEAALANGATEAQLEPVRTAVTDIGAETDALAAAVANVPPAPAA
jgi:hypothetical protein